MALCSCHLSITIAPPESYVSGEVHLLIRKAPSEVSSGGSLVRSARRRRVNQGRSLLRREGIEVASLSLAADGLWHIEIALEALCDKDVDRDVEFALEVPQDSSASNLAVLGCVVTTVRELRALESSEGASLLPLLVCPGTSTAAAPSTASLRVVEFAVQGKTPEEAQAAQRKANFFDKLDRELYADAVKLNLDAKAATRSAAQAAWQAKRAAAEAEACATALAVALAERATLLAFTFQVVEQAHRFAAEAAAIARRAAADADEAWRFEAKEQPSLAELRAELVRLAGGTPAPIHREVTVAERDLELSLSDSEDEGHTCELDSRVLVIRRTGTKQAGYVRYRGDVDHAPRGETWLGVELDKLGAGGNDGMVGGRRYFVCPPGRGLFVRPNRVRLIASHAHHSAHTHGNRPSSHHHHHRRLDRGPGTGGESDDTTAQTVVREAARTTSAEAEKKRVATTTTSPPPRRPHTAAAAANLERGELAGGAALHRLRFGGPEGGGSHDGAESGSNAADAESWFASGSDSDEDFGQHRRRLKIDMRATRRRHARRARERTATEAAAASVGEKRALTLEERWELRKANLYASGGAVRRAEAKRLSRAREAAQRTLRHLPRVASVLGPELAAWRATPQGTGIRENAIRRSPFLGVALSREQQLLRSAETLRARYSPSARPLLPAVCLERGVEDEASGKQYELMYAPRQRESAATVRSDHVRHSQVLSSAGRIASHRAAHRASARTTLEIIQRGFAAVEESGNSSATQRIIKARAALLAANARPKLGDAAHHRVSSLVDAAAAQVAVQYGPSALETALLRSDYCRARWRVKEARLVPSEQAVASASARAAAGAAVHHHGKIGEIEDAAERSRVLLRVVATDGVALQGVLRVTFELTPAPESERKKFRGFHLDARDVRAIESEIRSAACDDGGAWTTSILSTVERSAVAVKRSGGGGGGGGGGADRGGVGARLRAVDLEFLASPVASVPAESAARVELSSLASQWLRPGRLASESSARARAASPSARRRAEERTPLPPTLKAELRTFVQRRHHSKGSEQRAASEQGTPLDIVLRGPNGEEAASAAAAPSRDAQDAASPFSLQRNAPGEAPWTALSEGSEGGARRAARLRAQRGSSVEPDLRQIRRWRKGRLAQADVAAQHRQAERRTLRSIERVAAHSKRRVAAATAAAANRSGSTGRTDAAARARSYARARARRVKK